MTVMQISSSDSFLSLFLFILCLASVQIVTNNKVEDYYLTICSIIPNFNSTMANKNISL